MIKNDLYLIIKKANILIKFYQTFQQSIINNIYSF